MNAPTEASPDPAPRRGATGSHPVTHKAFWVDPYCTRHEATITACAGAEIRLDSTIFFQRIRVEPDWTRRYRLMRLHFAAELVLELFYRQLAGVDKVGAHIAPNKARIDFAWPENISPLLPVISERANRIIASDLEIRTGFEDEASERRYWEIEGLSRVPCGGTHVRRTGEIGPLRLKRDNVGKGKERVEIYLDDR